MGKTARVIVDINNLKSQGQVVINGLEWTARSSDDTIIFRTGDVVTVETPAGSYQVKILNVEKTA